jgi:AcrR family transcriptional regulator
MTGRPPAPTRQRILKAAVREFHRQGFRGGRVEQIARVAKANLRMIYHYFGDKEGLYLASLEQVYLDLRAAEQSLDVSRLDPVEGIRRFVEYTFDHFLRHPEFIGMLVSENQLGAKYLRRSRVVSNLTPPLAAIEDLLARGARAGVFRSAVDPVQFFVTLHALCYLHGSNRDTLSVMFQTDLSDSGWLAARKRHVLEVVFGYLCQRGPVAKIPAKRNNRPIQGGER